MRGCDAVLHEAAQVSVPRSVAEPLESYRINVMGTLHVFTCLEIGAIPEARKKLLRALV
mgnify:CR=1 FL=1